MPEQVDDQGMRDRKGVQTIRDSCYRKQAGGCREDVGGGGGGGGGGGQMAANTSVVR